jgi:hypothetical protein
MSDNCALCGNLIDRANRPRSIACSQKCSNAITQRLNRSGMRSYKCAYCAKQYTGRPRVYCGSECRRQAMNELSKHKTIKKQYDKPTSAICKHCGEEYPLNPESKNRKYCSIGCAKLAFKTHKATCIRCGIEFMREPKSKQKFCGIECSSIAESEKHASARLIKDEVRRRQNAEKLQRKKEHRHQCAIRLALFRKHKSNAAVSRILQEPETTTHGYLKGNKAYSRIQKQKSKFSAWRKNGTKSGMISSLYPKEKLLCDEIEKRISEKKAYYEREIVVIGNTKRRADFIVSTLYGKFIVEAKNTNYTSDVDCAIGQALVRSIPFDAIPVVAFPSDLVIDSVALESARRLGVRVVDETSITRELGL